MEIDLKDLPEKYRKQAEAQIQASAERKAAKMLIAASDAGTPPVRATKYGNKPTQRIMPNGKPHTFDSKKEAVRYDWLVLMLSTGRITDLKLQPQFTLKESYITPDGERSRAVIYKADFSYTEVIQPSGIRGSFIVEDVKSEATRRNKEYIMKKKLMQEKFGITVKEW